MKTYETDVLLIGAGAPAEAMIHSLHAHSTYRVVCILDPNAACYGSRISGVPVTGWLQNRPLHVRHAFMAAPSIQQGFDRKSVFHLLKKQHLAFPSYRDPAARVDDHLSLREGAVILSGATVERDAVCGINVLIGEKAIVTTNCTIPDHAVLSSGTVWTQKNAQKPDDEQQLQAVLAQDTESLHRIIQRINLADMEILLVVNRDGVLVGTITDGDIRRAILSGIRFEQPASLIMNPAPTFVIKDTPRRDMLQLMRKHSIRHIPVLDTAGRPVRIERMERLLDENVRAHDAIVMAGGLGTRLRPLTETMPKPLLHVGERPILDHILSGLKRAGIDDVVLSVNYRGDQIRRHVGDGSSHALKVNYITEKQRLGTAGALSLLSPRPQNAFLVMNGDLLTNLNYAKLLDFQKENNYALVMGVRKYEIQIPYGVVHINGEGHVDGLREKPLHEHFINAGIYVLRPDCLDLIPHGSFYDMTDLINELIRREERVGAFPILEYWKDIGRPEDLQQASRDQLRVNTAGTSLTKNGAIQPMEAFAL
ncbi:MAG: CBS domain-containing protein [Spartobacteria bacterium]|nr:CBS domain-containing protein [Spartobacteria bacterium]